MVVFTCGYCGESLQKPKVEKHYLTKCRNKNPNLSCMDCFKDFLGEDYIAHNKCITEEERYSGKGFTPKEKKGEKKQSAWVDMLQSVLDEQKKMPNNVQKIIETISKHQNTPRKKPKFINFVKNVCGHKTNPKDIDQAWDLISVKLADLAASVSKNQKQSNATNNTVKQENDMNGTQENGDSGIQEKSNTDVQDNTTDKHDNILKASNHNVTADTDTTNKESEQNNGEVATDKKLSKKQRKEEKKRKKYEAELQSAVVAPPEEAEIVEGKKEKKKKNRTESINGEEQGNSKKQKKRKRQDTVNSTNEVPEPVENQENEVVKEKTKKKKLKTDGTEEVDESVCLHDQNVATIEECGEVSSGKFNWLDVIMSVLEKKGNEVPLKRLQKKVLAEYTEATGREVDGRIAEKFIKKLKSAPNVRVDKNKVLLIE